MENLPKLNEYQQNGLIWLKNVLNDSNKKLANFSPHDNARKIAKDFDQFHTKAVAKILTLQEKEDIVECQDEFGAQVVRLLAEHGQDVKQAARDDLQKYLTN